jgi:hypothetical protein
VCFVGATAATPTKHASMTPHGITGLERVKVYIAHCRSNIFCNIFLNNDFELFEREKSFLEICHLKCE